MLKRLWSSNGKAVAQEKDLLLSHYFAEATDPVEIYDRDYRLVMANRSFSSLYDLPTDQLIGKLCYELLNNREIGCQNCHLEEVFQNGQCQNWEENLVKEDGQTQIFEVHATPVRDHEGVITFAIKRRHDISGEKSRQVELKSTEDKYHTIVDMTREGIFVLDNGAKITFANKRLAGMLGCRVDEIIGSSLFDFVEHDAAVKDKIGQSPGVLVDIEEVELLKKDGGNLFAHISLSALNGDNGVKGSVGIVTDITYLRAVEASNRSARELSQKIINSITDSLLVIDPKTYRIVVANDHFLARVGLDEVTVLKKTCYEITRGRSSPCATYGTHCPVRETALKNRSNRAERIYHDDQGKERMLQISTYPLLDSQQEVKLVIRLEHDITDKRKMEKTLASRTNELEKANNKLKTLFEISRQLTAISSLADLINHICGTSMKIFPNSEPVFLLFNEDMNGFLSLRECDANLAVPVNLLVARLKSERRLEELIRFLNQLKDSDIFNLKDRNIPAQVRMLFKECTSGFGIPIFMRQQCIGYFQMCSNQHFIYDPDDRQFFHALFAQVGSHIRRLILHDAEINQLRQQVIGRISFGEIIGQSQVMQKIYDKITLVANSDATVLITGENGTGKELVAKAIHRMGQRRKGPFVVANSAAYTPTLLASEIFGHEKGAFTGAVHQKKGRIERADGGTLFLDEIGNITLETQVLLLRFLQNHRFERVGGEETIKVNVRVLAATNLNLQEEVNEGRFRSDFYYRLNVVTLHLPPLRERKEDIPLLTQHFLKKYSLIEGKKVSKFDPDDMHLLLDYPWPGNVRQLENAISHAVILAQGTVINKYHLPKFLTESVDEPITNSLAENEHRLILRVLRECNGNKHEAARRLQISRSTLYSKIQRHKLYEI
jgi:PAS domain S-box-containing protein